MAAGSDHLSVVVRHASTHVGGTPSLIAAAPSAAQLHALEKAFVTLPAPVDLRSLRSHAVDSCAAWLITETHAHGLMSGEGRLFLQRNGALRACEEGTHALEWGDQWLALSGPGPEEGQDWFRTSTALRAAAILLEDMNARGVVEVGERTFHDGSLSGALEVALANTLPRAAAAARIGFCNIEEAEAFKGAITAHALAACDAVAGDGGLLLFIRQVETADDYHALSEIAKELHATQFVEQQVGAMGLSNFVERFGAMDGTLSLSLRALERIGASKHAAGVRHAADSISSDLPADAAEAVVSGHKEPVDWSVLPALGELAIEYLRTHRAEVLECLT